MEHYFKAGLKTAPPLLLLHGTGGDEHSLLKIAEELSPNSTILSLRGTVSEQGANRFFKRFAEGQFDLENLELKTDELLAKVKELSNKYQISFDQWVLVGYSNGANIAGHLLLERENSFKRGVLFHAMSLGKHEATFDLSTSSIWLSAGINDPIVPKSASETLRDSFLQRDGNVDMVWTNAGHQLTYPELEKAKEWFKKEFPKDEFV